MKELGIAETLVLSPNPDTVMPDGIDGYPQLGHANNTQCHGASINKRRGPGTSISHSLT
jgi:hypothetical protein